ncbi:MAG: preQ(1) synthase [Bacteroidetes bacterium]|nr:preQ(1) synthase [Bacteroidota bacterium]
MQKHEIKIADTRQDIRAEDKISILETFAFHSVHPQLIHINTTEFSAVCPGTGLPDIGTLDIWYEPSDKCVELKALKYYLFSYRNDGIFQEPVTDVIFDHLWRVLQPRYLRIVMKYNTRGGFDTVCHVEKGARTSPTA